MSAPPTPAKNPPKVLPYNRRVSLRYSSGVGTATAMAVEGTYLFRRVRVHDISQGGIGVYLKHAPANGTHINVRVYNQLLSFSYDMEAVVLHSTQLPNGSWLVGMSFARELTMGELASLV